MRKRDFFRNLLASILLKGGSIIETRDNLHQAKFGKVVEALNERRSNFPAIGLFFVASPFTSCYKDLDDFLMRELAMGGQFIPRFGVIPSFSKPLAEKQVLQLPERYRELFGELAEIFCNFVPDSSQ